MREIAKEPQNRFDYWIMKTFTVLPTDERFINLTAEQKELLWENYLIENPEIEKQLNRKIYDPDFEKEWEALDDENGKDTDMEDSDDDDFASAEENFAKYVEGNSNLKLKGLDDKLKRLTSNANEWEEVDD